MKFGRGWSRRRFLAVSGGAAAQAATGLKGLGQAGSAAARAAAAVKATAAEAAAQMPPPGVITGGIRPLMENMTARPLRYTPVAGEFVIRNGKEFFNRPIYGVSSPTQSGDFRVDAGDLPEFSMYLPGHGGNLKLGFIDAGGVGSKWCADADEVIARYRPGRMIYEIRDTLLGKGMLRAEVLTTGEGAGFMVKVEGQGTPVGTRLAWAFGGVSGRKGQRNGDIGCERQPVSLFFQVRAEECDGNTYSLDHEVIDGGGGTRRVGALLASKASQMLLAFPFDSKLSVENFGSWAAVPSLASRGTAGSTSQPILTGSTELKDKPLYLTVDLGTETIQRMTQGSATDPSRSFAVRSAQVESVAQTLQADTPDEFLNAAAGNFGVAAETIWDQKSQCVLHGGVAWRTMLAGWRGPYNLDALGNHDRAVEEIRHWLKRQNTTLVTSGDPAIGPWDANIHEARKEGMLHSNGDLSNNHYDMNMVFIDMTLRHLMWTGDLEFAKEIWPALERHFAWEHRLFRRTYTSAEGKELPLYEAYAAIWASDNLQYNGGGAAHSSAYNVFAFRTAAKLAKALGGDGEPYAREAELLHQGMQELLWVKSQGAYGESKDLMEPQVVYTNPALWTVYHTIDSEVPTPRQAWQMVAERLAVLRHVPVHGAGVPDEGLYMLSCSDWLPYMWSLNLLLLAENAHMALAMWQTGMRDEAYRVFKGSMLDSMYMGLCPGDFHMTSALDVHRQEAQRDFGDPLGISSRALVEGLFGVQPDLIAGEIRIRPGFPSNWNRGSLKHKDFDFAWKRDGMRETYSFESRLVKVVPLKMRVPARATSLPAVMIRGKRVACAFDTEAVGSPMLLIEAPASRANAITIDWHGRAPRSVPAQRSYRVGDRFKLPPGVARMQIDDPQNSLANGHVAAAGFHTVFANMHDGECAWTMPISFEVTNGWPTFAEVPQLMAGMHAEPVDLTSAMKNSVTEMFTRIYAEPRSEYCSLAFPDNLLGGWANPDGRATIDDAGLRAASGLLKTTVGVDFATPAGSVPNCAFVSYWKQDEPAAKVALSGRAHGIYLLMAGSTLPQCSRMVHGTVSVTYRDGTQAKLALRNPETWWPIEQDYLLDDYLFVDDAPLPPRVDLRTGCTRMLDPVSFHGKGRPVPGGAATILHLPLDRARELASLEVKAELYGVVIGLLGATLVRE
jgi:hypothetical protein